jgi:hypothetical protein
MPMVHANGFSHARPQACPGHRAVVPPDAYDTCMSSRLPLAQLLQTAAQQQQHDACNTCMQQR